MNLVLDPNNPLIETTNDKITGEGLHAFETNMPAGVTWISGLTVEIDIQSPNPGDEDQWENIHIFSDKGSWQVYLVNDRKYRAVASMKGPWLKLNLLRNRITK